jgi:hypothetical protein
MVLNLLQYRSAPAEARQATGLHPGSVNANHHILLTGMESYSDWSALVRPGRDVSRSLKGLRHRLFAACEIP